MCCKQSTRYEPFRDRVSGCGRCHRRAQVLNRARLSEGDRKEREPTPAGITHSSLLYDNDFAGETKGSLAVRAVAIRSDSLTTATFIPQKSKIC